VLDPLPGELGDVDQAIDSAQVDEGAEVGQTSHAATEDLPLGQVGQGLVLHLLTVLFNRLLAGQDHLAAAAIDLQDLQRQDLADEVGQIVHRTDVHVGGRDEAPQAQVDDQSALDLLGAGGGQGLAGLVSLQDATPGRLQVGPLLGQHQRAFGLVHPLDDHVDLLAHLDDLVCRDIATVGQLADGHQTLGLVAHVHQDALAVDPDDPAGEELTRRDGLEGFLVGLEGGHRRSHVLTGLFCSRVGCTQGRVL